MELMHTKMRGVFALTHILFAAGFFVLALSGTLSETVGWGYVGAAGILAGGAFLVCSRTAREFVLFYEWWHYVLFLDLSVAHFLGGVLDGDFWLFVFWTPFVCALALVLRFRPGWYVRAFTVLVTLGFVGEPPLGCIAYGIRETRSYGECVAAKYRAWAPMIGVVGAVMLDGLARTVAKHTMVRRAFGGSRDPPSRIRAWKDQGHEGGTR